ncbi:MAG: glycosyltransferase, partial [Calditrichaeota bacterium]
MPAGRDNPEGFWENLDVVALNDLLLECAGGSWDSPPPTDVNWRQIAAVHSLDNHARKLIGQFSTRPVHGFKDPRICLTFPFWNALLPEGKIVLCLRHPINVALSLHRRNHFSPIFGLKLWYEYNHRLWQAVDRDRTFVVDYDEFFEHPEAQLERLLEFTGLEPEEERKQKALATIRESLRHHASAEWPASRLPQYGQIQSLYNELKQAAALSMVDKPDSKEKNGLHPASISLDKSTATDPTQAFFDRVFNEGNEQQSARVESASDARIQVSIIIPVYNKVEFTRRCLETLYANTDRGIGFEVIVVDNASTDQTPHYLQEAQQQFPNLKYIRNKKNRRFAGACNIGARAARGEILVFLNNDTEPQPGWLRAAIARLNSCKDIGIVGCKLLYPDGTLQHAGAHFIRDRAHAQYVAWPVHRFLGLPGDYPRANRPEPVDAVTGACLFIERKLFWNVGGFDEKYGMYFEDTDLCMKVRQKGKDIFYEPTSVVIHHESKSFSNREELDRMNLKAGQRFFERWAKAVVPLVVKNATVKTEGKYIYLDKSLLPPAEKIDEQAVKSVYLLLEYLSPFYAHVGGIGDALLFMSTFYDRDPEAVVFSMCNSPEAMRAFFDNFPALKKVYLLPVPDDYLTHYLVRSLLHKLPGCKGTGILPREDYMIEWRRELDIFKTYGVIEHPQWIEKFRERKITPFQVTIHPKGSTFANYKSRRNIIDVFEWPRLIQFLLEQGIEPIILGTPDEQEIYPAFPGCIDKRSFDLGEQMRLIASSDLFIGADSWGKSMAALAGVPTLMFAPQRGKDIKDWEDPSENVYVKPWKAIQQVKDFDQFQEVFFRTVTVPADLKAKEQTRKALQAFPEAMAGYPWHDKMIVLARRGGLGDVLMALPLARAMKAEYPGHEIVFATLPQYREVVEANPWVDRFIPYQTYFSVLFNYDKAVNLEPAYYGIQPRHQIDVYLELVKRSVPVKEKEIVLNVPARVQEEIQARLAELSRESGSHGATILLHPAKSDPNRTWPVERWGKLAARLIEEGHRVILVGSDHSFPNRGTHAFRLPGLVDWRNQLSLLEFVALCRQADLLISTDSGPIQLAAASDIAIVGIYSVVRGKNRLPYRHGKAGWRAAAVEPSCSHRGCFEKMNDPEIFAPYQEKIEAREISPAKVFATWCLNPEPFACMRREITVEQVLAAARPFLQKVHQEQREAAFQLQPSSSSELQVARSLLDAGQFGDAVKLTDALLTRSPESQEAWQLYLEALAGTGRKGRLAEALESYCRKFPGDADALNALGCLSWEQGKAEAAIKRFQEALAAAPDHLASLQNLADVYLAAEKFEEAAALLARAIQTHPGDVEAFLKLAQMYGEAGQFDQARQLLESARKVDPRNPQVQQLQELVAHPPLFEAFTRISFGDLEGARPILERFVAEHPEHPQAWLALGDVLRAEGQPEEALACYRKAGTPNHFDAAWLARQALVLAELNRLEDALGLLELWQQEL